MPFAQVARDRRPALRRLPLAAPDEGRHAAPRGIKLDTPEEIKAQASCDRAAGRADSGDAARKRHRHDAGASATSSGAGSRKGENPVEPMLEITTGDFRFLARFEEELAPADRGCVQAHPPARRPHHPLPLERRVELDSLGRPRARDRAGERHLVPAPRRARRSTRAVRAKRSCSSPTGTARSHRRPGHLVGEPLRDARRGTGAARGARPPHALWEGAQAIAFREV